MRKRMAILAVALVAIVPAAAEAGGTGDKPAVTVTKKQYGKRWPFTVPSGQLYCHGLGGGLGEVMFRVPFPSTNAGVYGVNGLARTRLKLPGITKIWRKNPNIPGARIDISPILDRGLKLCG